MFHVVFFLILSRTCGIRVFRFYKNGINLSTYATICIFREFLFILKVEGIISFPLWRGMKGGGYF